MIDLGLRKIIRRMAPVAGSGDETTRAQSATVENPALASTPHGSGFRARLEGLSLFDLVQLECLARSRRVVRVASAGRVGFLYFSDGEIVHATTRSLVGERAALEIMGWNDGVFEVCKLAWPEHGTISIRWQQLLLAAAKARDEASGNLVHLPSRRSCEAPITPPQAEDLQVEATTAETTASPVPAEPKAKVDSVPPPSSVRQAVRIDGAGHVVSAIGDDGEFSGLVAYASLLAGLIAEAFGLDQFKALDVGLASSRCVMYVEEKGSVVALRASNEVDLSSVLKRAGLLS